MVTIIKVEDFKTFINKKILEVLWIIKYNYVCFCFITVTNCSETNGIFGKTGSGSDPFANISQSSLEYFSNEIGDTVLFKVIKVIEPDYREVLNSQAKWIKENSVGQLLLKVMWWTGN